MNEHIVVLEELSSLVSEEDPALGITGLIKVNDLSIPFFLKVVSDLPVLFIHYNGAVDRRIKPSGINFQREHWADYMEGSLLYLADPTILGDPGMSLGWGQTPLSGSFFPEVAAKIALTLSNALGIVVRVHCGSSAGGYQASASSLFDEGSSAWVNNAQFDWTKYEVAGAVESVLSLLSIDADSLRSHYPWRVSIPQLSSHLGKNPRIHYVLNLDSPSDVARQLPVFQSLRGECSVETYHDPAAGHNPLGREEWVRRLLKHANSMLDVQDS